MTLDWYGKPYISVGGIRAKRWFHRSIRWWSTGDEKRFGYWYIYYDGYFNFYSLGIVTVCWFNRAICIEEKGKSEMKGKEIHGKMLTGLIPAEWKENVTEYEKYFACKVLGKALPPKQWEQLVDVISNEFEENLMEIYSNTDNGIDFIVYLRKGTK